MAVRVQVRDDGARKVFDVVSGRVYHIKAVQILPQNDLPAGAMSTAPTVGDAYSADRMNDWIATLKSRYNRAAHWGMRHGALFRQLRSLLYLRWSNAVDRWGQALQITAQCIFDRSDSSE